MKIPKTLLLFGFLAGFGAGVLVWQQFVTARLAAENQQLRVEAQKAVALTGENTRLASERIDPEELRRLREGQSELPRLRGQVSQLRRDVQEAKAAAIAAARVPPPSATTNSEPDELPVETFTANVTASVGWNGTLVTGGWKSSSGKRVLVLLNPSPGTGENQVTVQSRFVELTEDQLVKLGLDSLKSESPTTTGASVLSAQQTGDFIAYLKKEEGIVLLNAPRVTCLSGNQAQVQAVDNHTSPSGRAYTTGQTIDVIPTIAPDNQTVGLTVVARSILQRTPAGP